MTNFERRVQLNKIIESQLPEFLVADFPKAIEFFKQYYISQEYQGSSSDLINNLDTYLKVDNLIPEVIVGETKLSSAITDTSTTIAVDSTKGFPQEYGLLKIGDEIITYTSKTETEFNGCIRGFVGITEYDSGIKNISSNVNKQNVIFSDTSAVSHSANDTVTNLSVLFLQEFYKKLKKTFTPGLEETDFVSDLDVGNFIKHARNFYQSKGIEESVKILFKVLFGVESRVLDLEGRLIKPSSAEYVRREIVVAENISGNPFGLEGQTIYKSNDINTNASVSDVQIFTRNNVAYYKLGLFVGYNERDLIEGTFRVPGNSKTLETISVGDSIISVDSTIGFPESGTLISGSNTITYTSKSINQFFGCSGVVSQIEIGSNIREDETVYGYENGDITKRVDLRITGVVSDLVPLGDISLVEDGEEIIVKNLGELIDNPEGEKTYKQIFANSWIYNTKTRYQVDSISGSTFRLLSYIDKSSLKVGDSVDVLVRNSNTVASSNATIASVDTSLGQVILNNISGFTPLPTVDYDIRRNIKKVTSSSVPLLLGNNSYIANTLNVYTNDSGTEGYVASHSLPSYEIVDEIVESTLPNGSDFYLEDYDSVSQSYSTIKFSSNVRFINGDKISYTADNPLGGLTSGDGYFVQIVAPNKIRLYSSKSLQSSATSYVKLQPNSNPGVHRFSLVRHRTKYLAPNKILRKFPLKQNISSTKESKRDVGNIGILIDGVEITSPNSRNSIYYGPIEKFEVLNGGKNYDIINPPKIEISAGTGSTALVEPIISGSVKEVYVDPQDFDINGIFSLSLTGGNGSGCFIEPIIDNRFREIEFDSRSTSTGGGVDIVDETITFTSQHNLKDLQRVIYNQNGNDPISIGEFNDSQNEITGTLVSGDEYVVKFVNTSTVKLYYNETDANAGINTIGFSTASSSTGIHKFQTLSTKTLKKVNVLESGSGYQYRKLRVKPSGISTQYNKVTYENHGFETGDVIEYSSTGSLISGLSTTTQYSVAKIDSNNFRLIDVGVGATIQTDLIRSKYTDISDIGTGYHIFKYPDIQVNVNVSYGSTITGSFVFTPIVTGEITGAYLYESGSGYGSEILNLHKKPTITLKNGKNAELSAVIRNGSIIDVQVLGKGSEYFSIPEIVADDGKVGSGAILRPIISDGKIEDVLVLNGGIGYDPLTTKLYINPRGSGSIFDVRVRSLTLNDAQRFGEYAKLRTPKIFSNLYENDTEDSIAYGMYGYSEDLATNYDDLGSNHSPIIGWAYDGNPIYGPYGYKNPNNVQSGVSIIKPGYVLDTTKVFDRPSAFSAGFFIEDYTFNNSGALDRHNGRYCKTPEFPNGTYAYFAGITTSLTSNTLEPSYPYFIGNTFRSNFIEDNRILNQSFDFNNSDLVRNTFPYKVNDKYADYDFVVEPYEDYDQITIIDAVTKGVVEDILVVDGGTGYKVGDSVNFDFTDTKGLGLRAEVSEIVGKTIDSLQTTLDRYENCTFVRDSANQVSAYFESGFDFNNNDGVLVSGLTTSIKNLSGSNTVGISTISVGLAATMVSYGPISGGTIQDIFVTGIPIVSAGNSALIVSSLGNEYVRVLNNYNNGVLRVKRFADSGVAHTSTSRLNVLPERITISANVDPFESSKNNLVYFNGHQSVGIGTTIGGAVRKSYTIGGVTKNISIPFRSIYVPGHPFKTGQRVTLTKSDVSGVDSFIVGNDNTNVGTFNLPNVTTRTDEVYIINKSPDYIGLTTQVGLTTNTDGLFFYGHGSNNSEYLLKTNYTQILGDIDRIKTVVSTASSHGLKVGDQINLAIKPNTVVGLGTTSGLSVKFDINTNKLLINSTNASINNSTNTVTINNHGYKTGDKVFFTTTGVTTGITTGSYYVIEDSSNTFRLAETLYESNPSTEKEINIVVGAGDTHTFSLINPKIDVERNSDLRFNLGDSSLIGYNFKIFKDKEFKDEFVSSFEENNFNVVGVGSVGFGTAFLQVNYSDNIPSKLFYTIEKSGYISTADTDVSSHSEINYVDNSYNGTYNIIGVTTSTFTISPTKLPKVLVYTKNQTDLLEYSTKSSDNITGSINKVKIISNGYNFESLPSFTNVSSESGRDANLVPISNSVGKIKSIRVREVGYDYASDSTLRPEAYIPPAVRIDNYDTIEEFIIVSGGNNYITAPDLLLVNDTTKQVVDSTSLIAKAPNGSISEIEQLAPIYGIASEPHKVISINNSNGVGISSIITSNSGIATCTITTPILGFSTSPFSNGDEIYVEGIELATSGSGYNSENYGYRFFKVDSYVNSNPATLQFSLVDDLGVGLSTNPGIAKTFQSGYATIINKKKYPNIDVNKVGSKFVLNERLFVDTGTGFFEADLFVSSVKFEYIKVRGRYILQQGSKIKGSVSGTIADVVSISDNRAKFKIDYSSKQRIGWNNDIGKISEDYQVTPDNDYYQSLSYSIQSPITWNEFSNPVNGIVHPAGLKNFADVGISSQARVSTAFTGTSQSLTVLDVVNEKRVDTINYFDNVVDYDTKNNLRESKFLQFENTKLTNFSKCKSNRVLIHDDISGRFSSKLTGELFVEVELIDTSDTNVRYTIHVVDPDTFESQVSELVVQSSTIDTFLLEKSLSFTDTKLGDFSTQIESDGTKVLIFTPTDPYDRDHDIKVLKKTFTNSSAGIGSTTIGSIILTSSNVIGVSTIGSASSVRSIAEFSDGDFNGLVANVEIENQITKEINYVEAVLDFDGSNTYLSEYYFDNSGQSASSLSVGLLTSSYDNVTGIVTFSIKNLLDNALLNIRADLVTFANTSSGIGTYRFLTANQPPGTEKSARLESTVGLATDVIRVGTFDNSVSSVVSLARVSIGDTSSIHSVSTLFNGNSVTVTPGSFTNVNDLSGIGTFGGEVSGNQFFLNFYPDSKYADGSDIEVQGFNEVLNTDVDFVNVPSDFSYGNTNRIVFPSAFDGINGTRANKVNFNLTHEGKSIYVKQFTPSSNDVDLATGIFTIRDHFLNTGEELIYTPKSTFAGIGQSAMGIGSTENYLGIVTDRLPEIVYPIVITPDTFKLSTKRSYANAGISVTFTDVGVGNLHELEMTDKISKTIIALDGIVQQPLTFTPISHTLSYNSGSVAIGINTFNISGISSVQPTDVLKIDNEYMKVVEVGLSTNVGGAILGPINGIIQAGFAATFPTVSVVRASFGSTEAQHSDGANVQVYRGAFNIVGSDVYFSDPPKGNSRARRDASNLPFVKATFSGRTFLRSNYATNMVFDDISDNFTGIGKTYTLSVSGVNTAGVSNGNGVLFINGIFQTPSTENNAGNNYEYDRSTAAGISSVVFTGITSTNGSFIVSNFDVNQNQLPRGGLIVSLGSTPGLGYAPLLQASVKVDIDGSGSIIDIVGVNTYRNAVSISTAVYNNITGILEVETSSAHNLSGGDRVQLVGLHFTCPSGSGITTSIFPDHDRSFDIVNINSSTELTVKVGTSTITHYYSGDKGGTVGLGSIFKHYTLNFGSGYRSPVSIGVTDNDGNGSGAVVSATVGAGGTLSFSIDSPGSGYTDPVLEIPEPNYENLSIVGVSRLGIGTTTDTGNNLLLNISIGSATTSVGIGSTLFLVDKFNISRPGYGFRVGDVFKPVGLVTASHLSEPISEFQLEVVETFNDRMSSWSFGELDYIDSIKLLQDGSKTRFPLYYNGSLLSFEIDDNDIRSSEIDLDSLLLIFVNGVLQSPGSAYQFTGGTSFIFTEAPKSTDKVDIFFYVGEQGVDTELVNVYESIKIGDKVIVRKNPLYSDTKSQTRDRTVMDILGSDNIETDNYIGDGINETIYKPIDWTKQKKDKFIKGDIIYKTRDSLEATIYPSAKIIGDIDETTSTIFVDDAQFFNYEDDNYGTSNSEFDGLVVVGDNLVSAGFTATVSAAGTVSAVTTTNVGSGYSATSLPVKFAAPPQIGVGIGTTATAIATLTSGSVSSVSITNPGFGYSLANPPQLIMETPFAKKELIKSFKNVQGFSGIITGITTTTGTGSHPLALKINFRADAADANDLQPGYPIFVKDTTVGTGVTSVNSNDASIVGIGTLFLDNVYVVGSKTNNGPDAEIVCNVHTNSSIVGIATTGSTTLPLGRISWGRLYNAADGIARATNPVSIGVTGLTVDSGLSTFPTIQRRQLGLRDTGAIAKLSQTP